MHNNEINNIDNIISVICLNATALIVSLSSAETFLRIASIVLAIFYTIVKLKKELKK